MDQAGDAATETAPGSRAVSAPAWLAVAALALAGLVLSLMAALALWPPDSDFAVPVALWEGLRAHGPGFLTTWRHTPDNWLFTQLPVSFLLFELFGPDPRLAVGVGWLAFAASVGLTAALAWRLAGPKAAAAVLAVLPFAGSFALGAPGFLAHPISHDVTFAWGLVAVLVAYEAVARGRGAIALLAGLLVFADALSDPWALVAIAAPLLVVGLCLAAAHWRIPQGRAAAWLSASVLLAAIAARTQVFGAMDFLPKNDVHLASPSLMVANLWWIGVAAAGIFNIVPGGTTSEAWVKAVDILALAAILGGAGLSALMALRRASPGRQLIGGVAVVSLAATGLATAAGIWVSPDLMARFLPNLYHFGGLLVAAWAVRGWRRWSRQGRAALGTYAVLFVAAALASYPWPSMGRVTPGGATRQALQLASFLHAQGLAYGYGPYWGTQALAVTWLTGGQVVIRPITFTGGTMHRREAESSPDWYRTADEPAGTKERFLVIVNDGEACTDAPACVAIAERQAGPPSRRLAWRDALILVWDHPIAERIGP